MPKVLITNAVPQVAIDLLKKEKFEVQIEAIKNSEDLANKAKNYDAVLLVGGLKLDDTFFKANSQLKGVALFSVGYDNVDVKAAQEYSIPISNTPGVLNDATSDVAFLLMQMVSRKAVFMSNLIANNGWHDIKSTDYLGVELRKKTLGIYGLGRIGFEMAQKAKAAFGMEIIYHNRSQNSIAEKELDAKFISFEELLKNSDVLSVHTNLTPETKGIFNKETFAKMKPSSIFINTARGGIHNEKDLTNAIESKTIWGAGLDVTNPEPMKADNPLLKMENVCVFPHIGSATVETRNVMATLAAKNLIAVLNGKQMLTPIK